MSKTAKKTDPKLWEKVKDEVRSGDKGGKPDQWSARKAQMAATEYQKEGGGYEGKKSKDNHLRQWTDEKWGTKSGKKSEDTGERYLPEEARKNLSDADYKRTTAKKRADSRKGRQFSAQPKDVAVRTAKHRETGGSDGAATKSKAELYAAAKKQDVPGRSKMSKAELERALA